MRIAQMALATAVLAAACGYAQPDDFFNDLAGGKALPLAVKYISASAIASHTSVAPGQTFHVAIELSIADHWVYYSPDPRGKIAVMPGLLGVEAGAMTAGETLWPKTYAKDGGDLIGVQMVYQHRAIIYVPLTVGADAAPGSQEIVIKPLGQICEDDGICIPIEGVEAVVRVQVASSSEPNPAWSARDELPAGLAQAVTAEQLKAGHSAEITPAKRIAQSRYGWWAELSTVAALALAVVGGLIFNIMPCVLPVIPIRILSVVEMAGGTRRRFVTLGLAFAGGIVLFFAGLAGVNLALRLATNQALNVSDHFQYPAVGISMAMVMVAVAANLFGVFSVIVPSGVASLESKVAVRRGHLKSVIMGFMMAILATPCSFGILFGVMAWAQVKSPMLGTMVFLMLGFGMAAPHAVLAAFPVLIDKLPKPGQWMELFRQAMGFIMLGVALWLFSWLAEDKYPFWVIGFAMVLTMCLWVWAKWVRYDAPLSRKLAIRVPAVALTIVAGLFMLPRSAPPELVFAHFDEAAIQAGRSRGDIVLVKVTANWCTECYVIEHRVFRRSEIAEAMKDRGVLAIKADVTDRASPDSKWVKDNFAAAPPLTIIYPTGGGEPVLLPGGFSPADLIEALDLAAGKVGG